jgi:hypothetical protein
MACFPLVITLVITIREKRINVYRNWLGPAAYNFGHRKNPVKRGYVDWSEHWRYSAGPQSPDWELSAGSSGSPCNEGLEAGAWERAHELNHYYNFSYSKNISLGYRKI